MAKRKRKSTSAAEPEREPNDAKRSRQTTDSTTGVGLTEKSVSYGRVDPTYGQRSAFPGLDDYVSADEDADGNWDADEDKDRDSELDYTIDRDALRYLRSVRIEASTIPTLLVAPGLNKSSGREGNGGYDGGDGDEQGGKGGESVDGVDRSIYSDGFGDSRGWYGDGAYTAAPSGPISHSGDEEAARDPQRVYYASLLRRFETLRQGLMMVPPKHVLERLDAQHGCYMSGSAQDYRIWGRRVRDVEPEAAQLAGMGKETVLSLLRMLGDGKGTFLRARKWNKEVEWREGEKVGLWIWGLLARLPERGELVSEEVGVVRELGKRAVWILSEMKGLDMGGLDGGQDHADEGEDEGGYEAEEVLDVEVDNVDSEVGISDEDGGDNTSFQNGHVTDEQLSQNLDDTTSTDPVLVEDKSDSAANLAAARTRLLDRLAERDTEEVECEAEGQDHGREGKGKGKDDGEGKEEAEQASQPKTKPKATAARGDTTQNRIMNIRATLDMIITIAGEMYGQRDLLEFREVWG